MGQSKSEVSKSLVLRSVYLTPRHDDKLREISEATKRSKDDLLSDFLCVGMRLDRVARDKAAWDKGHGQFRKDAKKSAAEAVAALKRALDQELARAKEVHALGAAKLNASEREAKEVRAALKEPRAKGARARKRLDETGLADERPVSSVDFWISRPAGGGSK